MDSYDPIGDGEPRVRSEYDELPLATLLREFTAEARLLLRREVDVARDELRWNAYFAKRGAAAAGAAGALAVGAFLALTACFILLLASAMPAWLAAFIVFAVYGGGAFFLFRFARTDFKEVEAPRTREQLQENKRWLSETFQRIKSSNRASV